MKPSNAFYDKPVMVAHWLQYNDLQPPEATILEILRPRLAEMSMLDIGVGAGRTTAVFAPLVKNYVATDCAQHMIEACQNRFKGAIPAAAFRVVDAADMQCFPTASFDLVLFSFNGIDHTSRLERFRILSEVRRVMKPDGVFVMSTHNFNLLKDRVDCYADHFTLRKVLWRLSRNPMCGVREFRQLFQYLLFRRRLPSLEQAGTAFFNERSIGGLDTDVFYIRPDLHIRQLVTAGFQRVRVFSLSTGQEFLSVEQTAKTNDPWLYYLAEGCSASVRSGTNWPGGNSLPPPKAQDGAAPRAVRPPATPVTPSIAHQITRFFRNPPLLRLLTRLLLEARHSVTRICSYGVADGTELFSILVALDPLGTGMQLEMQGFDINLSLLAIAIQGGLLTPAHFPPGITPNQFPEYL